MVDEDEPPSLGKSSATTGPPSAAFRRSSGTAPPAAAFSHSGNSNRNSPTASNQPPSDDLSARWKEYEKEMGSRRSESSLSPTATNKVDPKNASSEESGKVPTTTKQSSYNNYQLYESPDKKQGQQQQQKRTTPPIMGGQPDLTPRQSYSFTKSSSYDTNELIRKYAGVTGIPPTLATGTGNLPRPSSFRRSSSSVREEAMHVLDLVDEHLNAPFHVRRTESGGFRATPTNLNGSDNTQARITNGEEDDDSDAIQPYYVRRSSSTSSRGQRRTPAALAGLSLSDAANNSRTQWKAGRYSFSDPKFRDDDYLADEEDDIIGPVGTFDENDPSVEVVPMSPASRGRGGYSDNPAGAAATFDGDFPRPSTAWSSRYTDTPHSRHMLDQWNRDSYVSRERQSARNMFMSSASNMRDAANNVGDAMATQSARVFGAGFSFRQSHTFGSQQPNIDSTNLHAVWKDDPNDEVHGTRVHKTWQQVMLNKRKRRRCLMSLVCLVVLAIIIGISVSSTSDNREAKRAADFPGSGVGETVTFYATSNIPYNQDQEKQFASDLATVPNDAEFITHLGNLQDATVTMCPESRFYEVESILLKSPIPLFLIPGAHDWVKCPRQLEALERWSITFGGFDLRYGKIMEVTRSENHPEIFTTLHNGVLFFGLNLANGPIRDMDVQKDREKDMKNFVIGIMNLNKEQFRAVVLMGNARPTPQQTDFFNSISDVLMRVRAPVAYVHADSGVGPVEYLPFPDIPNIKGIQVPSGSKQKPLKITVGFGGSPFMVG